MRIVIRDSFFVIRECGRLEIIEAPFLLEIFFYDDF